ncbi:MAG TPA: hypothetical protein VI911_10365 [Patescibacteria group bacterium]|nr:hypothetical protein [Patescibacteria group bacterium]
MADGVIENLVNDLLSRVQKLEAKPEHDHKEIQDYLGTLDRVAFSMTIAFDIISKVIVDKNLITKEELNKSLTDERDRVTKELQARMTGAPTPEEKPGT